MAPRKLELGTKKEEKSSKISLQSPLLALLPGSIDKGSKKVFKDLSQGCRDLIIP